MCISICTPDHFSHPAGWFLVRAVPGLPTLFPSILAILCGVWTPGPVFGSMHDFTSSPFLNWTSPRARREGLRYRSSVDYIFQASPFCSYIQQLLLFFHHSYGVSVRLQVPGQAWKGIRVSLLSSLL